MRTKLLGGNLVDIQTGAIIQEGMAIYTKERMQGSMHSRTRVGWQGLGARLQQGSPSKEVQGQGYRQGRNMPRTELQYRV